ncbi:glycosyltransferase family 2 protein [Candidatus Woesearchaeota archaeon]|nr:MAG: glycosyltransferase family 2 protein [Candidatus Woesearchaeota archaeon]
MKAQEKGEKEKVAYVVTPTYNERENIRILIPLLEETFESVKKKGYTPRILVVDDNSPDGTAEEVKKLAQKYGNIELLTGSKQGLGVAYQRGFKHVMDKCDAIIMMDADLSHPPSLIPGMLEELERGYTLVIGSRYIKGGGTPDWPLSRKLISRGGNFFARIVAGMYRVHDCTSGFRAISTDLLRKVDFRTLATRGYAFLTTLLYELYIKGAKIKEVPLVFKDRKYGETKLTRKDIIEFFLNAWRIRFRDSKRMIKFAIVGGSGIFVNLGVFQIAKLLLYSNLGQSNGTLLASSLIGDEISIIWNFILNHEWTFKHSTNDSHVLVKMLKFHAVAISSVVINNSVLFFLHTRFGVWDVAAKLAGILIAFLWNYFVNVKWTWREKI